MDNRKIKQYFNIFIVVALAICLIFIWILMAKVSNLENHMSEMIGLQHSVMNSVDSQNHSIQSAFEDFQEQQSWLGEIDVEVTSFKDSEGEFSFNWQVKELEGGSDVYFNYALADGTDYTEVLAEEVEKGLFQVSIPLEQELGPVWEPVIVNFTPNSQMETADRGLNYEFTKEDYEKTAFHYFVSVSNDDGSYKNGEIQTNYLQDFGVQQYGFIETEVQLIDEIMNISLHHGTVENPSNLIKEAYLLKYKDQELINEFTLDWHDGTEYSSVYRIDEVERDEDIHHVLKVVYPNGETFEKELNF